jgi:hypothetical protein
MGTSASSFGRALQVRATPPGLEPGAHLLSYEYLGDSPVFTKKKKKEIEIDNLSPKKLKLLKGLNIGDGMTEEIEITERS